MWAAGVPTAKALLKMLFLKTIGKEAAASQSWAAPLHSIVGECCWAASRRCAAEDAQVPECGCVGEQGDTTMHNTQHWAGPAVPFLSFLASAALFDKQRCSHGLAPACGEWGAPWLEDGFCWRSCHCPKPVTGCWVSKTLEEMNHKLSNHGGLCCRRGYS